MCHPVMFGIGTTQLNALAGSASRRRSRGARRLYLAASVRGHRPKHVIGCKCEACTQMRDIFADVNTTRRKKEN